MRLTTEPASQETSLLILNTLRMLETNECCAIDQSLVLKVLSRILLNPLVSINQSQSLIGLNFWVQKLQGVEATRLEIAEAIIMNPTALCLVTIKNVRALLDLLESMPQRNF